MHLLVRSCRWGLEQYLSYGRLKPVPCLQGETKLSVTPAQAGVQVIGSEGSEHGDWIPAFAGMTIHSGKRS